MCILGEAAGCGRAWLGWKRVYPTPDYAGLTKEDGCATAQRTTTRTLRTSEPPSCDEHTRSTRSWIILSHRPAIHTVVMEKALIALYYPRTRCPQIHAFRTANETLSCIAGL